VGCPVVKTGSTPKRPEVADILRDHAHGLELTPQQARAVCDIIACRSARLGGHLEVCPSCGFSREAYNSCRNRHCPKCQILKQELWAEAQEAILLPVPYFQIVFTIPGELHPLFRSAAELCLNLLFQAVAETLTEVARTKLKADIGFTAVLHTWTQILRFHPHIHCIVPAGGLAPDLSKWITTSKKFFLPIDSLREVFRGKLLHKIEQALRQGSIPLPDSEGLALLKRASMKTWDVDIKPPLGGPHHVVRYLSRYVHRIAISNSRILSYDGSEVIFRYKDRSDGNKTKILPLSGQAFSRRFLSHVLPDRFVRIRHYGILAARRRKDLAHCRRLLGAPPVPSKHRDNNWAAAFERIFGRNPLLCPVCNNGIMETRCRLPPLRL
jgi:Putative transposase/Transposase zinc-binding domain